jgi:hypothetical protein
MMEIMVKGLTIAKMGANSLDENTPKFIQPICPIDLKVWNIVKKRLHQASAVRV